ncbi:M23 family metallopeptidase [Oscillatoria sp. FACHB-1407]|uniref:peptidoglycan DD-metalloendopeptidase family protein n=1 Tax=Oscillatoria sp. FACHB-1407 TaxID=2692847 RepID=UPI001684A563|nr:peptidoglycan DD-metalloendopeptidase family protein [Oscillatoria sp. FACHB-1407]MBD2465040.1 M23 family metallopeptidase [Oscillatoria sp. FACHB-1407]
MRSNSNANTLRSNRIVNLASQNRVLTEQVNEQNPHDIFRIRVRSLSSFTASVNGLQRDANLQLLNSQGRAIQTSARRGRASEKVDRLLEEGTYYVRVYLRNKHDDTTYGLSLSTANVSSESSNTVSQTVFNGKLYQVTRGNDNLIYSRSSSDGSHWSVWRHTGASTYQTPAMTAFNGRLFQLAQGTDRNLYLRSSQNGENWSTWASLNIGGQTLSAPEMTVFQNQLVVAVRGINNQIYTATSGDGDRWNAWQDTGRASRSGPGLTVFNNRLYIAAQGTTDNDVYFSSSRDGVRWNSWSSAGIQTLSNPELGVFNEQLYVAVRGTDNNIYLKRSADGQVWGQSWLASHGTAQTAPEMDVFGNQMVLTMGDVEQRVRLNTSQDGTTWSGWTNYGQDNPAADALWSSNFGLHSTPTDLNPLRGFRDPLLGLGPITQHFGGQASHTGRSHYSIDYGVEVGMPIYAMYSGTVVAIEQSVPDLPANVAGSLANASNVNYVLIKLDDDDGVDDGYRNAYLHIRQNSVRVAVGQRVAAGDLIAESGHNGWSTAPHLHVEVHRPNSDGSWGQTVPFEMFSN